MIISFPSIPKYTPISRSGIEFQFVDTLPNRLTIPIVSMLLNPPDSGVDPVADGAINFACDPFTEWALARRIAVVLRFSGNWVHRLHPARICDLNITLA